MTNDQIDAIAQEHEVSGFGQAGGENIFSIFERDGYIAFAREVEKRTRDAMAAAAPAEQKWCENCRTDTHDNFECHSTWAVNTPEQVAAFNRRKGIRPTSPTEPAPEARAKLPHEMSVAELQAAIGPLQSALHFKVLGDQTKGIGLTVPATPPTEKQEPQA